MRIYQSTIDKLKDKNIDVFYSQYFDEKEHKAQCYQKHKNLLSGFDYYSKNEGELFYRANLLADEDCKNGWETSKKLFIKYRDKDDREIVIMVRKDNGNEFIEFDFVLDEVLKSQKVYEGVFGIFANQLNDLLWVENLGRTIGAFPTNHGVGFYIYDGSLFYEWEEYFKEIMDSLKLDYKIKIMKYSIIFKINKNRKNLNKMDLTFDFLI